MRQIRYQYQTEVDYGTADKPDIRQVLTPMSLPYSSENEALARKEAYLGEYTVEDVPGQMNQPTQLEQLRTDVDDLTLAVADLLGGGMV